MAKLSFLNFLKRAVIGSENIVMTDLKLQSSKSKEEKLDDYSKAELLAGEFRSPTLTVDEAPKPQIPIIGIGGCGIRVASVISNRFSNYEIEYNVMGIDTNEDDLTSQKNLSHSYLIPGSKTGTAKQYRIGATLANIHKKPLIDSVEEYLGSIVNTQDHEIIFLVFGSGGTGVGVAYELSKLLIEKGKRPVAFFFLPGKEENTRIKFTAAAALYKFSYGPKEQCLNLCSILIENDYFMERNTRSNFASVLDGINERVGATIADLVLSTTIKSDGYSADLNEFLEIFRNIRGIGSLTYMHSGGDYNSLIDFFDSKQNISNSIEIDIYNSTRSYLFIEATQGSVSAREYRTLISSFDNSDIFPKFKEIVTEGIKFEIRGIFTGLKLPSKVENLLQMAQDTRIGLLNKEIKNTKDGKSNPKIDRMAENEEIEAFTDVELANSQREQ